MCFTLFALVIAALLWLLFDRLDHLGLAVLHGQEHVVYAIGWQIVAELWMLPVLGAVLMLLGVFLYLKFFSTAANPPAATLKRLPITPEGRFLPLRKKSTRQNRGRPHGCTHFFVISGV